MKNKISSKKKIAAIILAAGLSSRFPGNKLLYPLNEIPLIMHAIENARKSACSKVYVIIAEKAVENIIPEDCIIVKNYDSEKGISSSIARGLLSVDADVDAVVFLLGDQPFVKPSIIDSLIDLFERKGRSIVSVRFEGVPRNPVLFSRERFDDLLSLTGDKGAQILVKNNLSIATFLDIDNPEILLDIDTMEDISLAESIINKEEK